jgi:hypothetical protein
MRLIRAVRCLAALTLVAFGSRLVAQQTVAPPTSPTKNGKAEIAGLVIDSLNRRYLRGADVIVEGANAHLVTDSAGRFRFDGLTPGTYRVGVFHPVLDTLGISLSSRPFRVGPDSTGTVVLSVPSAASIISGACQSRPSDQGNSAVIGRVEDPESLQPVPGAEVSLVWIEVEVSKQIGIREIPHVLRDTTNALGAFHICGVPSAMDGTLQARKAKAATSGIPISLGDADSQIIARKLLLSRSDSAETAGSLTALGNATVSRNASVSGTVLLDGSATHAGSRVELVGTDAVVLTNDKGEFAMTKLPSGSRLLFVRHLGFGAQVTPVNLAPSLPQSVSITLTRFVAIMDPVLVTARLSAGLDRVGFNQRKRAASGYFFGPDQLHSMHPLYVTDILRRLPAIRVSGTGRQVRISSARGPNSMSSVACVQYFLDDMPWQSASPGDINDFVNGSEIIAMEAYQPGQAPVHYARGLGRCATIVLWTRFRIPEVTENW